LFATTTRSQERMQKKGSKFHAQWKTSYRPGVSKLRPVHQMRPANPFCHDEKNNVEKNCEMCLRNIC